MKVRYPNEFPDISMAASMLDAALTPTQPPTSGFSAAYALLGSRVIAFTAGQVVAPASSPVVAYRKRRQVGVPA